MSQKSFYANNSLDLSNTERQSDAVAGEMYFGKAAGSIAIKDDFWSLVEAKVDVPYTANMTSIELNSSVSENSIIRITGAPTSEFAIHGIFRNNNAKLLHIYNDTTQKMVFKYLSSTETTPANRISTPKLGDLKIDKKGLSTVYYDDTQSCWVAAQSSGGSGGTSFDQVQPGHGFSVLTPIYHDGTEWKKAQANSNETLAMYVVTDASTDSFTAMKFGVIEIPSHGLTVGEYYHVSADTAGTLTSIEPIYGYSNPVLYVQDATLIHILAYRPSAIGDGTISDSEIGSIVAFPVTTPPRGFLPCDGSEVSRTTYADLFNVIGTSHGYGSPQAEDFNFPVQGSAISFFDIIYAQNKFTALGINSGTSTIYSSTDGITWTPQQTFSSVFLYSIAFNGTRYVAVGSTTLGGTVIVNSLDGITWVGATAPAGSTNRTLISVTNHNTLFVAVAQDGAAAGQVITSPDGITWTGRTSANAFVWRSVVSSGTLLVALASNLTNCVMTSPDGITWTARNPVTGNSGWNAVAYGNGRFVAVSTGGTNTLMHSTDGITWTTSNAIGDYFWKNIIYAQNKFIVLGDNDTVYANSIATSPNGIAWTLKGRPLNNSAGFATLGYGNGILIAARTVNSTNASIAVSLNPNFNVPDYRGRFLRGVDGAAGNDPDKLTRTAMNVGGNTGNNPGSIQDDAFRSHTHNGGTYTVTQVNGAGQPISGTSPTVQTGATGGNETRPKNAYVNFFIRYEARGAIQAGTELPTGTDGQILELVGGEPTWVDRNIYSTGPVLDINFDIQVHYKTFTTDSVLTFSNIGTGKIVRMIVENPTLTAINLTLPTTKNNGLNVTVAAGTWSVFTFVCGAGFVFATSEAGMN